MVIEYKAVSLRYQKITEDQGCNIELHADHIKWSIKFLADEPINREDKDLGWKNVPTDFTVVALKKNIAGVEMTLTSEPFRWKVSIMIRGFAQDICIFFMRNDKENATDLFNKVSQYLLDGSKD